MARNGDTTTTEHTYDSSLLAGYVALAGVSDCPLRLALHHMSIDPTCGEKITTTIPLVNVQAMVTLHDAFHAHTRNAAFQIGRDHFLGQVRAIKSEALRASWRRQPAGMSARMVDTGASTSCP